MSNTESTILQRITMENPLSCFYKLPLKDVALRRVALILYKNPHLLGFVGELNLTPECKSTEERESVVKLRSKRILSKLPLPEPLKEEILCFMRPLCREIGKWIHFHENFCMNYNLHCVDILQHMYWTPLGTIDYKKTAAELIRHRKLDIDERYKLACLYCISDSIPVLWSKMPLKCVEKKLWEREKGKICFYDDKSPLYVQQPQIVVFWTYVLEGREDELDSFHCIVRRHSSIYQYFFESLAVEGYKTATEYFLRKLTYEEREVSLVRTARAVANKRSFDSSSYRQEYQKFSDVLFYLFSAMSEEQMMDVLKTHPFEILKCCLDWPRQEFFVHLAELTFPYLKEEDYCRLMFILSRNINWGYDYSNIFRKFFLMSPKKLRDYSLRDYGLFMRELFHTENVETVKFIFRNLDAKNKLALAFNKASFSCCWYLMYLNRWDWLELFIREAMLSETHKEKFALGFAAHHPGSFSKEICQMFVAFVNSIDVSCSTAKKQPN